MVHKGFAAYCESHLVALVFMLMLVLMMVCMKFFVLESLWQLMQTSLPQHCACTEQMCTSAFGLIQAELNQR